MGCVRPGEPQDPISAKNKASSDSEAVTNALVFEYAN